nr:1875_t:CDS:2 [Entrophospora candida]
MYKLGLRKAICDSLKANFNIITPTRCQNLIIPKISRGHDLFVKDSTGSGKTFGIVLALLNKNRSFHINNKENHVIQTPLITSIFMVPSRELAYQIESWIYQLLGHENLPMNLIVQTVVKSTDVEEEIAQLKLLKEKKPHILVCTATRLHDIMNMEDYLIDFQGVKTIVLDEADHLIRLPGKHAPIKKIRSRINHPKPAELIMKKLFSLLDNEVSSENKPQVIVSSATINHALKHYFTENKYVTKPEDININQTNTFTPTVSHHCLVINSKQIKNLMSYNYQINRYNNNGYNISERIQSFDDDDDLMLDSVAGVFESDNVKADDKDTKFIKDIGMEKSSPFLPGLKSEQERQILYVAPEYLARGIDIPWLSHVFILGLPSSASEYLHMSGRTGRMGRNGKVFSFIREGKENSMSKLFNLIKVPIIPYGLIE